jgi:hypothetical protein
MYVNACGDASNIMLYTSRCQAQLGFLTQGDPSSDQVKTLEPQLQKSDDATKNSDDAEKKKKELLQSKSLKMLEIISGAPSIGQIKTFQQRAWSSEEFQIALHERVGEMKKMRLIGEEDEKTIYRRIHQRDPDIIKTIIEIRDDDDETSTDEETKQKQSEQRRVNIEKLKDALKKSSGAADVKPFVTKQKQRLENIKKLKEALEKPSGAADVKPFLSARLPFKRTSRKRCAHILQVSTGVPLPLVRYFVENVWKLERPDVIISVTGGASLNFDLHPDKNDMLMRGMMEGTRKLKPWSVPIYGCISVLSVCGYCIVHACCVRVLRASLAHA